MRMRMGDQNGWTDEWRCKSGDDGVNGWCSLARSLKRSSAEIAMFLCLGFGHYSSPSSPSSSSIRLSSARVRRCPFCVWIRLESI